MKGFYKIFIGAVVVLLLIIAGANLCALDCLDEGMAYRVQVKRMAGEIEQMGIDEMDYNKYPDIEKVVCMKKKHEKEFFEGENSPYEIRKIGDKYYRFDLKSDNKMNSEKKIIMIMNGSLCFMAVGILSFLFVLNRKMIRPFTKLREIPYELAKGNLTIPLQENKNRFFGKFVWGMNLLREHLEQDKEKQLSLQKEKSTLLLSLSHDMKTPLAAIKLYAKALSRNLYESREKQIEVAEHIHGKAEEMEQYLNQMIRTTNEDFLELDVKESEFYLSEVMKKVEEYYKDKLSYLHTEFRVSEYADCLLKGDKDRLMEVLENIIENAIKYGDGKKIEIRFSDEEDCRLVWVTNSGSSLDETEIPHIFDSFWRGSNAGKVSGSGLGLYICRQLMYKMHGDIFAQSENGNMTVVVVLQKL